MKVDGPEVDHDNLTDEFTRREWAATIIQNTWRHYQHKDTPSEVCCACLIPLPLKDMSITMGLCQTCHQTLIHSRSHLPKLGQLVQIEAKYQQQLAILRTQQQHLRLQQEGIIQRQHEQEETRAMEKRLARERQRHVARRQQQREEEKKRAMACAEENSTPQVKLQPTIRRSRVSAPSPILPPSVVRRRPNVSKTTEIVEQPPIDTQEKQQLKYKMMMTCYAQDLTPLVDGHKPKQLDVRMEKPQSKGRGKTSSKHPLKKVQLLPLVKDRTSQRQEKIGDNREEDEDTELRVLIPRRDVSSKLSTPLTAEIKPMSWMYDILSKNGITRPDSIEMPPSHPLPPSHEQSIQANHQRISVDQLSTPSYPCVYHQYTTPTASISPTTVPTEFSSTRLASLLEKYNVSVSTRT